MLPVKKIYIDLPVQLLMPENTVFYVDDVTIPASWYNIDSHNRCLFVVFAVFSSATATYVDYPVKIPLDVGNYHIITLGEALKTKLTNYFQVATGSSLYSFSHELKIPTNNIQITASDTAVTLKIITDENIPTYFPNEISPYKSLNELIGNFAQKPASNVWLSGYINFQSIRNVYIRSPNLGSFGTMSLRGDRDIIKKVSVSANANEIIFNNVMVGADYLECSRQTLSRLEFKLEDVNGNVIDLNGAHVSFSLIFSKYDTEI